jgi:hypothetical protein
VKSSPLALPTVTFPLKVAVPAQVRALIEKSFVPSDMPLIKSVKLVLTCVASAVVEFENVWVTEGDGILQLLKERFVLLL